MTDAIGQWHYMDNGVQKGPFSTDQMVALVKAGVVGPPTQVWNPGMPGWAAMSQSPLASTVMIPPAPLSGAIPGLANISIPGAGNPDTFGGAIHACLTKYADFSGRARRPEFWWFALFGMLGNFATTIVDAVIFGAGGFSPLQTLFSLALMVPSLAAGARRLHDTDRTGWWQLLWMVPIAGWIVMIIFLCQRGTPQTNRFG
jgi:uncharacterized membrane protein YhaH (DUF805 family)